MTGGLVWRDVGATTGVGRVDASGAPLSIKIVLGAAL